MHVISVFYLLFLNFEILFEVDDFVCGVISLNLAECPLDDHSHTVERVLELGRGEGVVVSCKSSVI